MKPAISWRIHGGDPARRLAWLVGALLLGVAAGPAVGASPKDDEQDQRARQVYFLSEVEDLAPRGAEPTHAELAMKAYLAEAARGAMTAEGMKRIYQAAGGDEHAFKVVATLIDKGLDPATIVDRESFKGKLPAKGNLKIDHEHSVRMAEQRDAWIERVIQEVATKHKPRLEVARSDSGNTKSGMKSDLDQTFFVFEVDEKGRRVKRRPDLDEGFVKSFGEEWTRQHPDLPISALDVVSIEGRKKFADPRVLIDNFSGEFRRTATELRRITGAYTFQGATVAQMQFRALAEVLKNNQRAYQIYGYDEAGNWVKKPGLDVDDAITHLFGVEPELMPAHAFGAAMANYVYLLHYRHAPKFEVKYHLRTLEDAMLPLLMREKYREDKVELANLDEANRRTVTNSVVDALFSDPVKNRRHKLAMEISVAMRLQHKNEADKIKWFSGGVPADTKRQTEVILGELARDMYGDAFNPAAPDPEHIKAAESHYRDLATEFCLESAYHSSVEAMKIVNDGRFREPFDFQPYRHLLPEIGEADWPAKKRQLQDAAHITFLYGIYDLGLFNSLELIRRLHTQFGGEKGIKLQLLSLWARGQVQGIEGVIRDPVGALAELKKAMGENAAKVDQFLREQGPILGERVQRHIEAELGFERIKPAHEVNVRLGEHQLRWRGAAYLKERALDPGNIDALAQVLRVYIESKGDLDRTRAQMVNEFIMAVPIAGQIYSATQSDWKGLVLMAGALQFPAFGGALLVYSVGEAGYAIYDIESRQPTMSNIEEAIYRGYAGPDTRAYAAPPPFSDKDEEDLQGLIQSRDWLEARLAEDLRMYTLAPPPGGIPDLTPQKKEIEAIKEKIGALQIRKAAFVKFRDDPAYGGYFTQWGAITEQTPMPAGLLDDIELIVGFSPAGIVDFAAKYDKGTDEARWAALPGLMKAAAGAEDLITLGAEYEDLDLRRARYERAQRYRNKATGQSNDVTRMTELEARSASVELMHKLRRDSVYPGMIKLALASKADEGNAAQANTDTYVDRWLARHGEATVARLVGLGLVAPSRTNPKTGITTPAAIPEEVIENLKNRLQADFTRGRELYKQFEAQEQRRKEVEAIRVRNRLAQYHGQAAGVLIERMDSDPGLADLKGLLLAMRIAAAKRHAPVIKASVFMTKNRDRLQKEIERARKGAKGEAGTVKADDPKQAADTTYDFRVAVQVEADPSLYHPPYQASVIVLDLDQAKAAANGGRVAGLDMPLLPDTQDALKRVLREKIGRGASKEDVLIPLVSVYASGMADLSRALPGTVNHLPGVDVRSAPASPTSMSRPARPLRYAQLGGRASDATTAEPKFLMGQVVAYTTTPGKTGDFQISTRRQKERSGTDVIVASKTLAKLDESQGKALVYNLYVADDPAGDFRRVMGTRGLLANAPIEPETYPDDEGANLWNSLLPRRIAKDKVLFPAGNASTRPEKIDQSEQARENYKPFHFMVGEQWVLGGQAGEETYSEVTELGPTVLIVGSPRKIPFDATEAKAFFSSIYGYFSTALALGLRDQDYQFPGAHFTIAAGNWRSHGWSPRYQGGREFGQGGAELMIPGSLAPIPVNITAERGDFRASRAVTIVPDDPVAFQRNQQRQADNLRVQFEGKIAPLDKSLAGMATSIAEKQALLKKAQDNPQYVYDANQQKRQDFRPIFERKMELKNAEFNRRRLAEVDIPLLRTEMQARMAFEQGLWEQAYKAYAGLFDLQRAAVALANERLAAIAEIQDWYYAQPPARPGDAASLAEERRRAVAARPGNARNALRASLEARKLLTSGLLLSAKWTGRMENVKKALAERQEMADGLAAVVVVDAEKADQQERQRREQQSKAREARAMQRENLRDEAEITALLTGDRAKAAKLYVQGLELHGAEFNKGWTGELAPPWYEGSHFPAWWPDSPDGGKTLYRP